MRNKNLVGLCLLTLGAGVWTETAWGQAVSATLVGTVTDASRAVVPGASVTATEVQTGVRGPSLINYDFSVFKQFPVKERFKLEFRTEFCNLTNSPHFGDPSGKVNSGNFGEISGTMGGYGNRDIQLALRVMF